jgi:replicative DNA helicase
MENITTEKLILSNLYKNNEYASKVIPYIKEEYFQDKLFREIFNQIKSHVSTYNNLPNKSIAIVDTINNPKLNELESDEAVKIVSDVFAFDEPNDYDWLLKESEDFCKNRALYLSVMKCINVYDGSDKKTNPNSLPDLMRDAIAISFDTNIGMDYFDDAMTRFLYYTNPSTKIKFDLVIFNKITNGGVQRKTLNVVLAPINAGKTMMLCHLAAAYLQAGFNVLYISLEVAQEEIGKRIDSNLLDININDLNETLIESSFMSTVNKLKLNTVGKLIIKEYAPKSVSRTNLINLLSELDLKKNFKPDIIVVDYLSLLKADNTVSTNSNTYLTAVAEELRAVGVETNSVIWSAAQLTRDGQRNLNEAELTDIAAGIGISETADFMALMYRTEELDQCGKVGWKQLKNRYGTKTKNSKFTTNVILEKQRFLDDDDYVQNKSEVAVNVPKATGVANRFSNIKI